MLPPISACLRTSVRRPVCGPSPDSPAAVYPNARVAILRRLMSAPDVIVVGGGVIGCAIAHALARARLSVTLLERDTVGAHASSAAAGMLAPYVESGGEGALCELGPLALAALATELGELRERSGIDPDLQLRGVLLVRRAAGAAALA